jgi:hypothetical protein
MSYKEIKKIYQTKDYDFFKFMKGNRPISQIKLTRMINKMRDTCPFTLVRVNHKHEICDGQHTYLALKTLNMPINFYIVNNETIEDVRVINSNMKNWDIWDYVLSFADSNNENYIKLRQLKERYSQFHQNELFVNLALKKYNYRGGAIKDIIKDGEFIFDNYYECIKILDKLTDYEEIQGIKYTNYTFLRAVVSLLVSDIYDHNRMLKQIRKYPHIVKRYNVDGYIEELLRKYNYRMKPVLYFHQIKS